MKKTNKPRVIKYRSVYWVKLGKTFGTEIYKTRPCAVMSNDWQNIIGKRVVVVPLTTAPMPSVPFHISIEFDGKEAKILPEQIRSVDKKRIGKKIGELPEEIMIEIEEMLRILLNFHK
ncbi:type II toxin-antitoxin system PemK/MazF family toxin [endosymbiont GvMRE of Glomus versiforme]|uniref:type II toxin-antitoxin system PemK/MazF family toxin n=1 Tax=endosymbiont GvMRE of Glomus versiforme TaxID=2039283 RepID=UPI001559DF4E|nr:type II toxin-antitoxin system PemK/MazF family toxin [endosymbiont GvMRE of Glomus versiforme]